MFLPLFLLGGIITGHAQPRLGTQSSRITLEQPSKGYKLWLETGDGNVITGTSDNILLDDNTQRAYPAMLFAARLYDDRQRPPRPPQTTASIAGRTTNGFAVSNITSAPLTQSGKLVKLFTSVGEVVPGDPMCLGISIRIAGKGGYRLTLKYNSNKKIAFTPIDPRNATSVSDYRDQPVSIPAVRTFYNETVKAGAANGLYANSLIIEGNASITDEIRNVFITLLPGEKIDSTDIEVVYDFKDVTRVSDTWETKDTDKLPSMPGKDSHDPNNVIVREKCLPLSATQTTLHYTVNFENIGVGDATMVKAAFYHPQEMDTTQKIRNLQVIYSDRPWKADMEYNTLRKCYVFTINPPPGAVLEGTGQVTGYPNNPKSKGKLEFDITVTRANGLEFPDLAEAFAEIYLLSLNDGALGDRNNVQSSLIDAGFCLPGTEGFELPVRTNNAHTLFSEACNGCEKPCTCENPHGVWEWLKCRWWVVVIVILALVLFWLLYKLRTQNN